MKLYSNLKVHKGLAMKKGLVTVKQAASLFSVSPQTIRDWDNKGKLKAIRHPISNYRLYRLVDLRKLADKIGEK